MGRRPLGRVQSPGPFDGRGRWRGGVHQATGLAGRLLEQGNTMVGIGNLSAGCFENLSAAFGARGLEATRGRNRDTRRRVCTDGPQDSR
ncbi:hypothetical protein Pyrde_1404 [Pyrodictium delaneyi]|uniref:Uncharacterized protein n=1 Tax=Pyrodictium delaneyi TaxID=1273541 RepID=A0A0P0N587_9CREN|nr:hypothetical protein Pyrde_1404 [Pyrodictium delaneyi]